MSSIVAAIHFALVGSNFLLGCSVNVMSVLGGNAIYIAFLLVCIHILRSEVAVTCEIPGARCQPVPGTLINLFMDCAVLGRMEKTEKT